MYLKFTVFYFICFTFITRVLGSVPLVINTWYFQGASQKGWETLMNGDSALDALVAGCSYCEEMQCDGTVGFGGSPDENGDTSLDAMIMEGKTMNVGAVANLRNIKNVIAVARHVLENTKHSLIVGEQATEFALMMGFVPEPLNTDASKEKWQNWRNNNCQPNFRINVVPDSQESCGPYEPISNNDIDRYLHNSRAEYKVGSLNHDTIGMIVIDADQNIVAGTSTNGVTHKIPGRVGDSPITGSGAYADNSVGAAAATGDGDIMMRFLPSLLAVENLRQGLSPNLAGENALKRIAAYYPTFSGAIIVATKLGEYGAACYGMENFPFSVSNVETGNAIVETVNCFVI